MGQNNDKSSKTNAVIHNFRSFRYMVERLKTTAENFRIKVRLIKEKLHIIDYPFCGTKGRGLFYCSKCNQMNTDVVGCLNIARKLNITQPLPKRW